MAGKEAFARTVREERVYPLMIQCTPNDRSVITRSKSSAKIVIAILIISSAYLAAMAYGKLPFDEIILALVVYLLGFIPVIVYLWRAGVCRYLPILPLHGLFYSFTFGAPVLFSDLGSWVSGGQDKRAALLLVIYGLIALYVSYAMTIGLIGRKRLNYIPKERLSSKKISQIAWLFIAVYLLYVLVPVIQSLPTISRLSENLGYVGMGAIYLQILLGKAKSSERFLFYFVLLPFVFIARGATGALAQMLLLVLFLGIIYWQVRKRIPWGYIAGISLIFIILNPVKSEFRAMTWEGSDANLSFVDKALLFGRLTMDYYSGRLGEQEYGYTRMDRINHIGTFANVISATPGSVPFWGGGTYKYLFVGWIPRIIWPGKPEAPTGNDFGRRYSFISPDDFSTTYNLPWIIEFYANFGSWAVMVGMAMVGVLFAWLITMLDIQRAGVLEYSVALTIGYGLFYAESNLALMLGGVLSMWVALVVILRMMTINLRKRY